MWSLLLLALLLVAINFVHALHSLHFQSQHNYQLNDEAELFWYPKTAARHDKQYALIFLTGANISPLHYERLMLAIKSQTQNPMWIASPSIPANLPLPVESTFKKIDAAIDRLLANGLPPAAPIFIGGHSLGGATAQEYVKSRESVRKFGGSFFLGSSLMRKFNESGSYPRPWIQFSGELDGLHRPMRVAQSLYHHRNALQTPVVVVKGMNHMQFVDDDFPGTAVTKRADLHPTVDSLKARVAVAKLLVTFIELHAGLSLDREEAAAKLSRACGETEEFLSPLIKAMKMEANYYLKPRCNSDHPAPHCPFYPAWPPQPDERRQPSPDANCWCGVPWSSYAVRIMANLPAKQYELYSVDAIHDVSDTHPFHHAHIWNNCTSTVPRVAAGINTANEKCTLNVTTVSQLTFDRLIDLDTGLSMSSAREIRVKMKSRQLYRRHADQPDAPYSLDLDNSICQSINERALQWALDNSSPVTRARYLKYGQRMEFLADYHFAVAIGPLWINTPLRLKEVRLNATDRVLQVQSISMRTTIDGWINRLHPDSGGQHYCKLLSPARAMEWIYTDGLRMKLGVSV